MHVGVFGNEGGFPLQKLKCKGRAVDMLQCSCMGVWSCTYASYQGEEPLPFFLPYSTWSVSA